jgi:hypothetical protein
MIVIVSTNIDGKIKFEVKRKVLPNDGYLSIEKLIIDAEKKKKSKKNLGQSRIATRQRREKYNRIGKSFPYGNYIRKQHVHAFFFVIRLIFEIINDENWSKHCFD